jgi:hypothetical protein
MLDARGDAASPSSAEGEVQRRQILQDLGEEEKPSKKAGCNGDKEQSDPSAALLGITQERDCTNQTQRPDNRRQERVEGEPIGVLWLFRGDVGGPNLRPDGTNLRELTLRGVHGRNVRPIRASVTPFQGRALILKNENATNGRMGLKLDTHRFLKTLDAMRQVPGRHGPEVLNKGIQKIVIGSGGSRGLVHLTPRSSKEQVNLDLTTTVARGRHAVPLIILLAAKWAKGEGAGRANTGGFGSRKGKGSQKFGKTHGDKLWRAVVKARAKRISAHRLRSVTAHVAGWLHALAKLKEKSGIGGAVNAQGITKRDSGKAAKSFARAATARSLIASLTNMVDDSGMVSSPMVLQAAINSATKDNLVYLERKLGAGIRDAINGTSTARAVQ